MAETTQEPTMEEILASIRRIISEEDGGAAPAAPPPVEDVLELTAPAPAPVIEPTPMPEPVRAAPMPAPQVAAIEDLDVIDVEEPDDLPVRSAPVADFDDGLIGEPALESAMGSMGRLASMMAISDNPNQTLEGLVQEMMRPMLKQWLDANLPRIVEEKVEAEILRMSRVMRRAK
jgi:cell pole-organizing protein PopZ